MYQVIIVLMLIVLAPHNAEAIKLKYHNGLIYHDSANTSIINNFVEDVLFLLPKDMGKALTVEYDSLLKASKFNVPNNYFMRQPKSREKLLADFQKIMNHYEKSRNNKMLAASLGKTVFDITENYMASRNDPLNDKLRKNLYDFLTTGITLDHYISYKYDRNSDLGSTVNKLYRSRVYKQELSYSELVTLTAELWTHVWRVIDKSPKIHNQYFVRIPMQIESQMNHVLNVSDLTQSEAKDAKEAWIVLNSDGEFDMEQRLIKKRLEDHFEATSKLQKAHTSAYISNKSSNSQAPVLLINTENVFEAVTLQQSMFQPTQ